MTILEFITSLRHLDIKLSVEDNRLRCNAPKGVLTPALKAQLSERKAEILAFFQKTISQKSSKIKPIAQDGNLPLSFAQQRLWFLNQLEGQSSTYNISRALQLSGHLNIEALEKAISEIVRRHDALRTTFQTFNGKPVQVIKPAEPLMLEVIDRQAWSQAEHSDEIQRLVHGIACKSFDLSSDCLIRVKLIKLAAESYILVIVIHHIVSDGWSMGIFTQELSTLYRDFSQGKSSSLSALPIQYADFANWQRQYLQEEVFYRQLNYWQKQLANVPALLELPTDFPRPKVQAFQGQIVRFSLDAELSQKLRALSQQSDTTLFITLLSAFSILLYRYSHAEDIVIGSPIANRHYREIEPLIGFFANTLLLRTNLEGNPSFSTLLQRVRQTALDAYANQDLPFEKLVEELNPKRSLSYHPLFQVMFVLQNTMKDTLELPGIQLSRLQLDRGISKFDLTLSIRETLEGLVGTFRYNRELFKDETIQRLVGHFQTLLKGIVHHPEQSISALPLLTEAERYQLLLEWNNTQTEYPQDICIHQFFEAQVQRSPNAIAVVFEDQHLTYAELDIRANQLAHYLQRLGVGPEALVGLCVDRSLEMIIGLLGILKAGGAYLPLDSTLPQQRLAYILEDTQISVLLTQQALSESLPKNNISVVFLDSHWDIVSQESQTNVLSTVTADNLVYVLYTSGSTGKPKGVAVEHRQLLNYVHAILERLDLPSEASFATVSTLAADLGNTVIFPALFTGGCLHVMSRERIADPNALSEYFNCYPIDCLKIVPSHLEALLTASHPKQVLPRQRLILGGEACCWSLIEQVQRLMPDCIVFNHYGPTETTVGVTTYRIEKKHWEKLASNPPIGRPLANTQIYLLDSHQQPVPIGVPGELYIGGHGIARGYFNRPNLTEKRFIPDSLSDRSGTRLYKTGDLARYLPDGNIEFLGRIDDQVKIRGFRIELGEVESTLSNHPKVKEAVVVACEEQSGDKRLVAYFTTPDSVPSVNINILYRFVKEQLPNYMVPSAFVFLEALPLTSNGKVNRRILPKPKVSDLQSSAAYIAPRTDLEKQLVDIWTTVLKLERIGVQDNFFELGGHSLLATQVVARIRDDCQIELPLIAIFETPTITELAIKITLLKGISKQSEAENEDYSQMNALLDELDNLSDDMVAQYLANDL